MGQGGSSQKIPPRTAFSFTTWILGRRSPPCSVNQAPNPLGLLETGASPEEGGSLASVPGNRMRDIIMDPNKYCCDLHQKVFCLCFPLGVSQYPVLHLGL